MNPVIEAIERTKQTELPDGRMIPIHSAVGPGSGRVIRRAIELANPSLGCEVGLAFGMSTLYILESMAEFGRGRLISMDPAQFDQTWQGGGLHNVKRAGYADRFEFIGESSQDALPRLAAAGTRIQFGFIDGWHTFDHTLVDFFYLDRMLDVGGVIVLDDVGYPSIRRLTHFLVTNRDYVIFDSDPLPVQPSRRTRAKRFVQDILHPLTRDNFTPTSESRKLKRQVDRAQLIVLRKVGDDERRFDHFVSF